MEGFAPPAIMHHIALFGPPGAGMGTGPGYLVKHMNLADRWRDCK